MTWQQGYLFQCWCGEKYHRGDQVSKLCCLKSMNETPGLSWAENRTPPKMKDRP